jgi:hypothetical protein
VTDWEGAWPRPIAPGTTAEAGVAALHAMLRQRVQVAAPVVDDAEVPASGRIPGAPDGHE